MKPGSDFGFGSPESPVWAIAFEDWDDYDYNDWCWIVEATPIDPGEDDCPTTCDTGVHPATGILQVHAGVGAGQSLTHTSTSTGGGPAAATFATPAATSPAESWSPFGNGWSAAGLPTLESIPQPTGAPAMMAVMFGSADQRVWQASGDSGSFTRARGLATADSFSASGGQYRYRTASGTVFTFNGFDESIPEVNRGRVIAQGDASGNQTVYAFNADGSIASVTSFLAGQTTPVEIQDYVSLPATDPNAGKVARIDVRRGDGTLVRSVSYAYYDGTSAFGTLGDLASISVRDTAGALLDAQAYRYTAGSRVLSTFDTDAVRRATAAGIDLATASNTSVAPFATNVYAYDSQNRVIRHDVQGAGCSSCTGGIGTFTYSYAQNPKPVLGSNLDWRTKTTEARPDGTERIVYSNARTQPMLEVIRTTDGGVTRQQGTYTRYDARGQAIWQVSPEAINLPANLADIEQYPDLLNEVGGNFQYISDASGLIEVTNYATATTATATLAGSVDRFVSSTAVMRGDRGTAVTQEAFTYFVQSGGGSTVTPLATRTTYPNTTTAGAQTTSYAYTFTAGTTQIVSQRTTLPTVTTAQNGPGTAVVVDRVFDAAGREIWSRDGDGFLRHTQYDVQTGAVVKSIVDVNTSRTSDFDAQSLPSGWATPTGGGLHLVTTHEVDSLGRITKATDPRGSITYTVYDDVNHSTRTYVGWNATTRTPTGPITVSRRDLSGTYTESLTYSAVPAVDAQGRPTGTEPITTMQSLTRSLMNAAGQVIAVDRYTNLDGLTYSTTTATLGLEGMNYLRTRYAYNDQGQVERVQNPAGTITISTFDGLARLTGTYVGTDDSTTNG
ncbi:MAG: hypothetical protein RLZZ21_767, partial [Planctomycetota bacterium]